MRKLIQKIQYGPNRGKIAVKNGRIQTTGLTGYGGPYAGYFSGAKSPHCCRCKDREPNTCRLCSAVSSVYAGRGCKYSKESKVNVTWSIPVMYGDEDQTKVTYSGSATCVFATNGYYDSPTWVQHGALNSSSSDSSPSSSSSSSTSNSSSSSSTSSSSDSLSSFSGGQSNSSASSLSSASSKSSASRSSFSFSSESSSSQLGADQVIVQRLCPTGDQERWLVRIITQSHRNSAQRTILQAVIWNPQAGAHCHGITVDQMFGGPQWFRERSSDSTDTFTAGNFFASAYDQQVGEGSDIVHEAIGAINIFDIPTLDLQVVDNRCKSYQICPDINDDELCEEWTLSGLGGAQIFGNTLTFDRSSMPRQPHYPYSFAYGLPDAYSPGAGPVQSNGNNIYTQWHAHNAFLARNHYFDGQRRDCHWMFSCGHLHTGTQLEWSAQWRSQTEEPGGTYDPWYIVAIDYSNGRYGTGFYTGDWSSAERLAYYNIDDEDYNTLDASAGTISIGCSTDLDSYEPVVSTSSGDPTSSSQTMTSVSSRSSFTSQSSVSSSSESKSSASADGSESTDGDGGGGGDNSESTDGGAAGSESTDGQSVGDESESSNVTPIDSDSSQPNDLDSSNGRSDDPGDSSVDVGSRSSQSGPRVDCCNYYQFQIAGLTGTSARLNGVHSVRHVAADFSQWRLVVAGDFSLYLRAPDCVDNTSGAWEVVLTDISGDCVTVWTVPGTSLCPPTIGWKQVFSCVRYAPLELPTLTYLRCGPAEYSSSSSSSGDSGCVTATPTDSQSTTGVLLGTYGPGEYIATYVEGAFNDQVGWTPLAQIVEDGTGDVLMTFMLPGNPKFGSQALAEAAAAGSVFSFTLTTTRTIRLRVGDVSFGDNTNGSPNPTYTICGPFPDNSSSSSSDACVLACSPCPIVSGVWTTMTGGVPGTIVMTCDDGFLWYEITDGPYAGNYGTVTCNGTGQVYVEDYASGYSGSQTVTCVGGCTRISFGSDYWEKCTGGDISSASSNSSSSQSGGDNSSSSSVWCQGYLSKCQFLDADLSAGQIGDCVLICCLNVNAVGPTGSTGTFIYSGHTWQWTMTGDSYSGDCRKVLIDLLF